MEQEHRIDHETEFAHWHRSDATKFDPVAWVLGNSLLLIWLPVYVVMVPVLYVVNFLFKGLGRLIGGTRSLILIATGRAY